MNSARVIAMSEACPAEHEEHTLTPQQPPTRQAVLILHADEYRHRAGVSHEHWAELVDAAYCARVPEAHRSVPAPDLGDVSDANHWTKLLRAWDQALRRYESGEQRFPLELEEAWVFALAEPYRSACIREISQRIGCYGARIREPDSVGDHASWGGAMSAWADVTVAMGQVLADGRIDRDDQEHLPELMKHIEHVQADLESLRRHVKQAAS